ncbi:MAG: hypothetical protein JO368_05535, partial [Acidimicrobiales bacterium]|nr:hypothetical protein [Acidimicrobiales bacterium]
VPGEAQLFKDPSLDEVALADALRRQATTYASHHPGYIAVVLRTDLVNLFDLSGPGEARSAAAPLGYGSRWSLLWLVGWYVIGIAAVAGVFVRRARDVPLAVWLTPLLFVLVTIPTLGTSRYRAPIEPFVVLLASVALVWGADRLRGTRGTASNPAV